MTIQRVLTLTTKRNSAQAEYLQVQLLHADHGELIDAIDDITLPLDHTALIDDYTVGQFLEQFHQGESPQWQPQLLQAAKAYGRMLYKALFAANSSLGREWQRACSQATDDGLRLEIRIEHSAEEGEPAKWGRWPLALIPFELLHDGKQFLFRRLHWRSVRTLRNQVTRTPRARDGATKPSVLLAYANVCDFDGKPRLPPEDFVAHEAAVAQLAASSRVHSLPILPAASSKQLQDNMAQHQPDVLIWVGHGVEHGSELVLHDDEHPNYPADCGSAVTASDFANLARQGSVDLALLWSCHGAGTQLDFDCGVAEALLDPDQGNLVTVLASTSALDSLMTAKFSKELLSAWATEEQGDVELALARARASVPEQSLFWARPVLFSRAKRSQSAYQYQPQTPISAEAPNEKKLRWLPSLPEVNPNFLGREEFLALAQDDLRRYPVLVLEGMAGVGKTEVALKLANAWRKQGKDVAFVTVNALVDASHLIAQMGQWRGMEKVENDQQLFAAYYNVELLLVIDNAEDILRDAAMRSRLRELLQGLKDASPHFHCLITSRRTLDAQVPWLYELIVPPLEPEDARELFIVSSGPRLPLAQHNHPAITELLSKLDGISRAIVLMASQLNAQVDVAELLRRWQALGVDAISADKVYGKHVPPEWDENFKMQSLRSSLNLALAAVEQENPDALRLFDLLGAFPAGVAQHMLPMEGEPWIADALALLLQHHLVSLNAEERRLSQPAPVASLAALRLAQRQGDWEVLEFVYERLVVQAKEMAAFLATKQFLRGLAWFLQEEANLLPALGRMCQQGGGRLAAVVASLFQVLTNFYQMSDRAFDGVRKLQVFRAAIVATWPQQAVAAISLRRLGDLKLRESDLVGARQDYAAALVIYSQIDAKLGLANTYKALGDLKQREDDLIGGRQDYDAALVIYSEIGEKHGLAHTYRALGDLKQREDDLIGARQDYDAALVLYSGLGVELGLANTHRDLGDLKLREDDLLGARQDHEAALTIYREIGHKVGEANIMQSLAQYDLQEGKLRFAFQQLLTAFHLQQECQNQIGVAACFAYLARIAGASARAVQAQALAAQALRIYIAISDRYSQKMAYVDLGNTLQQNSPELGLASIYLAWSIAQQIQDPDAAGLEEIFNIELKQDLPAEEYTTLMQDLAANAQSKIDAYLADITAQVERGEIDLFALPPEENDSR